MSRNPRHQSQRKDKEKGSWNANETSLNAEEGGGTTNNWERGSLCNCERFKKKGEWAVGGERRERKMHNRGTVRAFFPSGYKKKKWEGKGWCQMRGYVNNKEETYWIDCEFVWSKPHAPLAQPKKPHHINPESTNNKPRIQQK